MLLSLFLLIIQKENGHFSCLSATKVTLFFQMCFSFASFFHLHAFFF